MTVATLAANLMKLLRRTALAWFLGGGVAIAQPAPEQPAPEGEPEREV